MPSNRRALLVVFLVVVIDLLGFGVVLPMLALYAERLKADELTIGLLTASFSAMQFLFAPVWGRLSDRIGRRPVLIIGLAGSVAFYALFGYASLVESLTLLFVARIGAGIAGATIPTAQAYIADTTPPERRAGGLAMIGAAFGIGFTFGPLLGAAAAASDGLSPMPGWIASGLSAISLVLAIFVLPESIELGGRASKWSWLGIENFQAIRAMPRVTELILISFVTVFAFANFESTLSLLTQRGYGMSDRETYLLYFYIGLVLTLAQGVLVRRLNKFVADEVLAVWGILLMAAGLASLVVANLLVAPTLLLLAMGILVIGFALNTPSLQSMISRRSPQDQQGSVLGINQSASAMARILGPPIGIELLGLSVLIPYCLSAILMTAVFFLLIRVRALSREAESSGAVPDLSPE